MKRRDFIVNSLLTLGGTVLLNGCKFGGKETQKNAGSKVLTRKFQGKDMPLLSLGCMRLPTDANGQIDMAHFEKMVEYAMQRGVNYFDTAYMYHKGESETAVGNVLSNYKRESFYLVSKNPLRALTSKADVRKIFEEQLKKCRTDYFDLYMAHNMSRLTIDNYRNYDVYEQLLKFKEEGKIRHVGFSYHDDAEFLEPVVNEHPWEFCMMQLNYLDWYVKDFKKHYEIITKAKTPIITMEPLRGGGLTKLTGSAKAVIADEAPQDTQASFGLRWAASKENVFTVLSGMSSLEQVQENVETFTNYRPFTKKEAEIADKVADILQRQGEINCTGCKYCQDCPRGIDIPMFFLAYNEYKSTGNPDNLLKCYNQTSPFHRPDRCIKCKLCNEHCPQLLDIPPLLEMIDETIKTLKISEVK
ncbi:MAG: aldo/keto reductase [Endomicrobium sp.]|jgi:predicted aldo/keto reductase-like oxidoreductase|nr:aldo/keto reductase [Endomicrobium sp.]